MKKRFATANWKGNGKEGKGLVTVQSTLFNNAQYSYSSRFEDGVGTNPEELIAAAHAGCFSMKLSFILVAAGFTPENIDTHCDITLDSGSITNSHLTVKAKVSGISTEQFNESVLDAAKNCPVSKVLSCEITHVAELDM